jgi:hypothetical protein
MLPLFLLAAAADARTALLTPTAPVPELPQCLKEAYRGSYGGQHLFMPSESCYSSAASATAVGILGTGSIVPDAHEIDGEIVWVGHAGVAGVSRTRAVLEDAFAGFAGFAAAQTEGAGIEERAQVVFEQPGAKDVAAAAAEITLIHASDSGMFLSVPRAVLPLIDTFLPRHLVPVGVAPSAVPLAYDVPEHYAKHLAEVTRALRFDPDIATVVNTISAASILKDVRYLTGEDSDIVSRHSFTEGARVAAKWIKGGYNGVPRT